MLVKSIIMGLITAGAAGGVVYIGTDGLAEKSRHIEQDTVTLPKPIPPKQIDVVTPKKESAIDVAAKTVRETQTIAALSSKTPDNEANNAIAADEAAVPGSEKKNTKTKWIDQYLKKPKPDAQKDRSPVMTPSDADKGMMEAPTESGDDKAPDSPDIPEPEPEEVSLDIKIQEDMPVLQLNDDAIQPSSAEEMDTISDTEANTEANSGKADTEPSDISIEIDGDNIRIDADGEIKNFTIKDGMVAVDDLLSSERSSMKTFIDGITRMDSADNKLKTHEQKNKKLYSRLLEQAAEITQDSLREQAYFEIMEDAALASNFAVSDAVVTQIKSQDLAYAALNRLAVIYAQKGYTDKAFEIVDSVDDAELRDFLRLQIIQSVINPEKLPSVIR